VVSIKSLITRDRKDSLEARLQKIELNLSADIKLHKSAKIALQMYCSQSQEGQGDFASFAIKDEHVEFRYPV